VKNIGLGQTYVVLFVNSGCGFKSHPFALSIRSVIVDMGCGSGYFTKIIATCMKGKGKSVSIEPDRGLIQEAEKMCKRNHISNIQFKLVSTWKIPLKSNYADLTLTYPQ
jgi:protein-L-isoaspartate O-methyltransferase